MTTPSEQLRQDMGRTIAGLLEQCGLRLLEQPLRLEGWLRDLYPDHRAAVSVAIEGLLTQCHLASGMVQDVSARFALRSGISPQWADFGVRLWRTALKDHKLDVERVQEVHSNLEMPVVGGVTQTVESILGSFRD